MNKIFEFTDDDILGQISYVDTNQVLVSAENENIIQKINVGNIIAVETDNSFAWTIGLVEKIIRKPDEDIAFDIEDENDITTQDDTVRIVLIGNYKEVDGENNNVFKRSIEFFPKINGKTYRLNDEVMGKFMSILGADFGEKSFCIGNYAMARNANAILDGNKFFQRHAAILGSTGSGKSWTVANILESINKLANPNVIVFDLHNEYTPLCGTNGYAVNLKIAGPGDLDKVEDNVIYLPYWVLNREEMLSMILDRTDQNAPNQASRFSYHVRNLKLETLHLKGKIDVEKTFTVDSPIPFDMKKLIENLKADDEEMVSGQRGDKKGDWNGKLTRFITRLETKLEDKTYGFMYQQPAEINDYDWLGKLAKKILSTCEKGIKIINFSEVPSDILPIITGTLARLIYNIQFWMDSEKRTPLTLICDEAHLYLPVKEDANSVEKNALYSFERIAKEGRKYGISLLVVSQRPSDVSKTILSQCNNFMILRLTNDNDKSVVKNLLPDSMKSTIDTISLLDVGQCVVIGDSVLLPTKININKPNIKPNSGTRNFWNEWDTMYSDDDSILKAIESLRKQSKE